jgi:hypothetical protein
MRVHLNDDVTDGSPPQMGSEGIHAMIIPDQFPACPEFGEFAQDNRASKP